MKKQQGISLLEIMVALALSLLIIAGVVRMVTQTIMNERFVSSEREIQENINFLTNRLGFVFKQALSSPCGNVAGMLERSSGTGVSYLKRAKLDIGGTLIPQNIPNVVVPIDTLPAGSDTGAITPNNLLMLSAGVEGAGTNEPQYLAASPDVFQPISNLLTDIVPDSEYIVVMQVGEKILLNTTSVRGVRGGRNVAGGVLNVDNLNAIPTTTISNNVGNPNVVPYLITNCSQGDIFVPNGPVTANTIPIADNLYFSGLTGGYQPGEAVIGPVSVFAYYVRQRPNESNTLMRLNLTTGGSPQPILGGVNQVTYSWGIGQGQTVQGFFTTPELLANGFRLANFRDNLIAVKISMQVAGFSHQYGSVIGGIRNNPVKTVERVVTLRNK